MGLWGKPPTQASVDGSQTVLSNEDENEVRHQKDDDLVYFCCLSLVGILWKIQVGRSAAACK